MNVSQDHPLGPPDPAALPPPAPAPARPWRPLRSRNGLIGGVCAGFSAATGVDVTVVRLAFAVIGLTGVGLLAYLLLLVLVPKEDPSQGRVLVPAPPDTARWLRIGLLLGGLLSLGSLVGLRVGPWGGVGTARPWLGRGGIWFGFLLLLGGLGVIWYRRRGERATTATPADGVPIGTSWPQPDAVPGYRSTSTPSTPPTRTGLILGRVVAWLVVIAAVLGGAGIVILERIGALSIRLPFLALLLGLAACVAVIATAVASKAVWPILLAVAALAIPITYVTVAGHWDGGIGDRTVVPATFEDVAPSYHLAIGQLEVDLSRVDMRGRTLDASATVRLGTLDVVVPTDATVNVVSHVWAGRARVLGRDESGLNVDQTVHDTRTTSSGTIQLDVHLTAGQLRVCRVPATGTPAAPSCDTLVS